MTTMMTTTTKKMEEFASIDALSSFPSALTALHGDYESGCQPRSLMELEIMKMQGSIREKDEWWIKIADETIVGRWKQEFLDQLVAQGIPEGNDDDNNNAEELQQQQEQEKKDYQKRLVEFAIQECLWLADKYKKGPVRPAAVDGVFVRDDLDKNLCEQLLQDVAALRTQPAIGADQADRHPGTPQMVDLVHPSLYCYERGKTMVLANAGAEATQMPDWESFLGREGLVEEDQKEERKRYYGSPYSTSGLHWLPAEFLVTPDGETCEINSYINSLHPVHYKEVYDHIGQLFCHVLPLFEEVLAEAGDVTDHRNPEKRHNDCIRERELRLPIDMEWWQGEPRAQLPDETDEDYDQYYDDYHDDPNSRKFVQPAVPDFSPPEYNKRRATVNLCGKPLQVIVKIASLEIEAGESNTGGVWHVEGTLNERIVATACCYLECDNVAGAELGFRTAVCEPDYEQSDDEGVRRMYGLENEESLVQDAGFCQTKQGRVLVWPNTMQHRVSPARLVDEKMPGKRTIVCFFLVDPGLRVRSTATVPPQQLAWVTESIHPALSAAGMGERALRDKVGQQLASPSLLTYEAACERRKRLMDERSVNNDPDDETFFTRTFSLCEH